MPKKKRSRRAKPGPKPKLVLNDALLQQLRGLGSINTTVPEAAAVCGVSERTLQTFMAANDTAREAYELGKLEACAALRRCQWQAAMNGNITMQIWLGKQLLNQKDKHELGGDSSNPIRTINKIEVVIVDPKQP